MLGMASIPLIPIFIPPFPFRNSHFLFKTHSNTQRSGHAAIAADTLATSKATMADVK